MRCRFNDKYDCYEVVVRSEAFFDVGYGVCLDCSIFRFCGQKVLVTG